MSIRVGYCCSMPGQPDRKRWYCWRQTTGGLRKERLASYLARMQRTGHHEQAAKILGQAMAQGYRLPSR